MANLASGHELLVIRPLASTIMDNGGAPVKNVRIPARLPQLGTGQARPG